MSGRRRDLPPDELEVHRVLSPGSNTTVSAHEQLPAPKASISDSQLKDFKGMYKSMGDLFKKISKSGILDALGDSENEEVENEEVENNEFDDNDETDDNNEPDEFLEILDEDEAQGTHNKIKFGLVNEPDSGVAASTTKDAPPLPVVTQLIDNNNNNNTAKD